VTVSDFKQFLISNATAEIAGHALVSIVLMHQMRMFCLCCVKIKMFADSYIYSTSSSALREAYNLLNSSLQNICCFVQRYIYGHL